MSAQKIIKEDFLKKYGDIEVQLTCIDKLSIHFYGLTQDGNIGVHVKQTDLRLSQSIMPEKKYKVKDLNAYEYMLLNEGGSINKIAKR